MGDLVSTRRSGHVLVITMQREEKRNAVNQQLAEELDRALNVLEDSPDLWAGILTGTALAFSAGSDVTSGRRIATERGGEYGIIRREHSTPVIAAVEGMALGGGLEMVLSCDLVVASRTARFGLPEVRIGVVPTCAGLFRAPRAMPLNLARELILTGDPITAERAYAAGLVNVLTEPGEAVDGAFALAERIAANAPLSVRACLHAVNTIVGSGDDQGWSATEAAMGSLAGTHDAEEGIRAFLEKRPPQWTGR